MRLEYYYSRNDYSGRGETYDSSNMSRHHIISYPHMYAFGVILLAYFQTLGEGLKSNPNFRRFLKYYNWQSATKEKTIDTILSKGQQCGAFNYRENSCSNFFKSIAWTEANLFTGPAGKFRSDDPKQDVDGIPLSFSPDIKLFEQKLMDLRKQDKINGQLAMTSGEMGHSNLSEADIKEIAEEYISKLPKFARSNETRVSDWRAVHLGDSMTKRKYTCYDIFFSANCRNDGLEIQYDQHYKEKQYYKLELAKDVNQVPASQNYQKFCRDEVVVLTGIENKRRDPCFIGVLKPKGQSHSDQGKDLIKDYLKK